MDYSLVVIIFFLMAIGLIMLYSASYYEASMKASCNYDPAFYLKKQLIWMVAGTVLMFLVAAVDYHHYIGKLSVLAYRVSLILVAACLFFDPVNGARRWIRLGGFSFQPAEFSKIAIILFMTTLIVREGTGLYRKGAAIRLLAFPLLASAEIYFITENLSSAIIVFAVAFGMFFVARPDYGKFILLALAGTAFAAAVVWFIVHYAAGESGNFRFRRVIAWLDPEGEASSKAFQTIQALYAIGSGGLFGKGLGRGMQKLGYIPEVQNDMIFSVICEELGIFGAVCVILMFVLLCWRLLRIAFTARDVAGSYLSVGVFCHIAIQVFLNIAVATNTIPNTGVTLPFISYGGTSILFTLAEMGIVLNVSRQAGE